MRSKIIALLAAAFAIVICITLILFWQNKSTNQQRAQLLKQMNMELSPLEQQRSELMLEMRRLNETYEITKNGYPTVSVVQTDLNEAIYRGSFNAWQKQEIPCVLALSDTQFPGAPSCITLEEFEEMMNAGWSCCIAWDGQAELKEYVKSMKQKLREIGLEMPKALYFADGACTSDTTKLAYWLGFDTVIHHGELSNILLSDTPRTGRVWMVGTMDWAEPGAISMISNVISRNTCIVLTDQAYAASSYDELMSNIQLWKEHEQLAFLNLEDMWTVRAAIDGASDTLEEDHQRQVAELQEQLDKINDQIQSISDKYHLE